MDDDFREFVAARADRLLRLAVGLAGSREAGEDLLQTTLAKAYASWPKVRAADDPDAYVRRTMVNARTSAWRRRRVDEHLVGEVLDLHGEAPCTRAEDRSVLLPALARLGRKQRAVMVLRYYEDRSDAEIAVLLGCSEATVRSQASRALTRLRAELGDDAGPAPGPGRTPATRPAARPTATATWEMP